MIEVLKDPARALREGVWMLPTIIIGRKRWHQAPPLAELLTELQSALAETE